MPPHNVEADVEVRNRVPQGSASHAGHAEIGIAQVTTYHLLRSGIVPHAKHAAIDRRSPLRTPSMLIGALGRPYGGEFHTGAGGEYALRQRPKSHGPAAKNLRRSPSSGRVAGGAFRVDRLCGDRVAL